MRGVVIALSVCFVACGGSDNSTGPSVPVTIVPSKTVTSITILGFSQGNVGFDLPEYVLVQFSDLHSEGICVSPGTPAGCTITGAVTWSSSNPQVATINASGVVHTLRLGSTTITATYQGKSVTKEFNVI